MCIWIGLQRAHTHLSMKWLAWCQTHVRWPLRKRDRSGTRARGGSMTLDATKENPCEENATTTSKLKVEQHSPGRYWIPAGPGSIIWKQDSYQTELKDTRGFFEIEINIRIGSLLAWAMPAKAGTSPLMRDATTPQGVVGLQPTLHCSGHTN